MSAAASAAAPATIAERNAANAQHSTGPVTAEGKARSAQNALRHGLSGRTVVLAHEDQAEYDAMILAFIEENQPGTVLEMQLVMRMVDCWWRLTRAGRVEAEFFEQRSKAIAESNSGIRGDAAVATLFTDPMESRGFRLFMRYLTNAQNQWRTACAEYQQTRKARIQREEEDLMLEALVEARRNNFQPEDVEEEIIPEPEPEVHAAQGQTLSGFVSHKPVVDPEKRPFPGLPQPCPQAPESAR